MESATGTILPSQKNTSTRIAAGFTNSHEELLWTFFTSMTLALLIVYQAAVFCISFFRLARAIINQRRIEKEGSDKAHFINGMGWICIALKLGALESVVGFAGGAFGADLTRRIMRMAARGCLCIGIVKGYVSLSTCRPICSHPSPKVSTPQRTSTSCKES